MKRKRFVLKIDDISKVCGRTIISGKSNGEIFTGKISGIEVTGIRTEPLFHDRSFLHVINGDVSNLKVGMTLIED